MRTAPSASATAPSSHGRCWSPPPLPHKPLMTRDFPDASSPAALRDCAFVLRVSREETAMTLQRSTLAVAVVGLLAFAGVARAADVPTHVVAANINDAGIDPARGSNHVWLA